MVQRDSLGLSSEVDVRPECLAQLSAALRGKDTAISHYSRGPLVCEDRACLIVALEEMGFHPEYHDAPQRLVGFQGDHRADRAHVIIRRAEVGHASNDIGFFFKDDGTCETIVSDYDRGRYGATWTGKVQQMTAKHVALAKAAALGHRAEARVDEQGRVRVRITGNL